MRRSANRGAGGRLDWAPRASLAGRDDAEGRRAASRRPCGFAQSCGRRRSFDRGRSDRCSRHQQGSCGSSFVRFVRGKYLLARPRPPQNRVKFHFRPYMKVLSTNSRIFPPAESDCHRFRKGACCESMANRAVGRIPLSAISFFFFFLGPGSRRQPVTAAPPVAQAPSHPRPVGGARAAAAGRRVRHYTMRVAREVEGARTSHANTSCIVRTRLLRHEVSPYCRRRPRAPQWLGAASPHGGPCALR